MILKLIFFKSRVLEIEIEQVNQLYKNSIHSQILGIIASVIAVFLFAEVIERQTLMIWLFAIITSYIIRITFSLKFNSVTLTEHNLRKWVYFYLSTTIFSGILWSVLAFGFDFSQYSTHLILLVIVYTGITASAHNTHTAVYPAFPAFFLPPILSLMYGVVTQFNEYGIYLSVAFMLYICTMLISSYNYHRNIINLLEFRFNNEKLSNTLLEKNKELLHLANSDGLTGIFNRRHFDYVLAQEWEYHLTKRLPISLILVDIDYFKQYNDTYGHKKGDQCLVSVAKLLRYNMRDNRDICSRYGGEEFVIILPQTDERGALAVATRIQQSLEKMQIEHSKSTVSDHVTMSFGVTSTIPQQRSYSEFFLNADKALYEAKGNGRNQIVAYHA